MNITPKLSDFFHRKWQVRSNKKTPFKDTVCQQRQQHIFYCTFMLRQNSVYDKNSKYGAQTNRAQKIYA